MNEKISIEEIVNALGSMQLQLMIVNKEKEELRQQIMTLQGGENGRTIQTGEDKQP